MVDTSELERFANALENTKGIDNAIGNAFYNSLDDTIAESAKRDHKFQNRTGLTQRSIDVEVDGSLGSVFVPIDPEPNRVGVEYVQYLVNYDPFLDNAFDKEIRNFTKEFEREIFEEIKELY